MRQAFTRVLSVLAKTAPVATVGTWYAYAAAADPDQAPYDLSFVRTAVGVVGTSLSAWLAARRSRMALGVGLVTGAAVSVLSVIQTKRHGSYVTSAWPHDACLREIAFNHVMPVVHAGLGLASLLAPLVGSDEVVSCRVNSLIASRVRRVWPQVRRLGLYYMVFSLVGHWGEMAFCTAIKHGLVKGGYDRSNHMLWDQWLFPFPAEGSVAVLMAVLLYPAKLAIHEHTRGLAKKGIIDDALSFPLALISSFLLNQLVCTSVDYTTGMVANRNYELWDYRDMRFNYKGQICLQNSLAYSLIATWAAWWLFPRMEKGMALAGSTALDGLFVGLGSLFAFLELLYHILPPGSGQGTVWDDKQISESVDTSQSQCDSDGDDSLPEFE